MEDDDVHKITVRIAWSTAVDEAHPLSENQGASTNGLSSIDVPQEFWFQAFNLSCDSLL